LYYCVVGFIVPEVSEYLSAYSFLVKQSKTKYFFLDSLTLKIMALWNFETSGTELQ